MVGWNSLRGFRFTDFASSIPLRFNSHVRFSLRGSRKLDSSVFVFSEHARFIYCQQCQVVKDGFVR